MKTKFKDRLPKKMSSLLSIALKDLIAVEKDPRYRVNMGSWHLGTEWLSSAGLPPVCEVCLAGATLAKTCKFPIEEEYTTDGRGVLYAKMRTIDYLRRGNVYAAAEVLNLINHKNRKNICWRGTYIVSYGPNPTKFKRQIRALTVKLKKHNL